MDRHNRSYFGLEFSYCTIPNELVPFDYQTYEAFPGHVEAGVTNLETGQAEYKEVTTEDKHFPPPPGHLCHAPHVPGVPPGRQALFGRGCGPDAVPYRRAFEQGCDRVVVILTKPRSFVRKPERLLPLIQRRYREYPNFCRTMEERPERDNQSRAELFQLEKEGKALVIAPNTLHGVGRIEHNVDKLRMLWAEGLSAGHGEHGADPILHGSMTGPSPGASRAKASSISPQQGEEGGHPLQLLPGAAMSQRGGGRRRSRDQRAGGQRKGHGKHLPVESMRTGLFLMHDVPAQNRKKSEISGGIFIWQKLW